MYIGDLHIHSRFSRATSKEGTPENLALWAQKKGIKLIGTGDFTHPVWREELKERLCEAEDGLYRLKEEYRTENTQKTRFVVSGEISSIYKKNGKVRKVHSLILLPGLSEAEELSGRLEAIGNLHSDGRPILGLSCKDLLEITLEVCPRAIFVPAHIWTPHFSLFGAFSGFDAIEECFEDLTPYIHALETGLSSDPPMNWRLSALDGYQLISNSDAHSPAKLGREANLFNGELSYEGLFEGIQKGKGLFGTIEFFPEEGKYHYDGHRKCHLCLTPGETEKAGGICPICGKKLTVGVSHRVEQLADRPEGYRQAQGKPFESLVPLEEVIASSTGRSPASTKVRIQYEGLLKALGPEFEILREVPIEDIKRQAGERIGEGIYRLREGKVIRKPGFDGEYGKISLFEPWELSDVDGQMSLFTGEQFGAMAEKETAAGEAQAFAKTGNEVSGAEMGTSHGKEAVRTQKDILNKEQKEAVCSLCPATAVIAGPGTGKTKTLVARILYLLQERGVKPSQITAVTFTKKAAEEIRERMEKELGKRSANALTIGTFHAICYDLLKKEKPQMKLADDFITAELVDEVFGRLNRKGSRSAFLRQVSLWKTTGKKVSEKWEEGALLYEKMKKERELLDFDDLLLEGLKGEEGKEFSYLFVDEFQDVSPLQYDLVKKWAKKGKELFVIGDPDQSIYGFRGADSECFHRLQNDFPGLNRISLKENYRSIPAVLKGAKGVISHNGGEERVLEPVRKGEGKIRLVTGKSEWAEAIFVAKEINRLVGGLDMLDTEQRPGKEEGGSFGDIGVLYRTKRQAALLEQCLHKEGIPYVVAGKEEFLLEKNVRRFLCLIKGLLHEEDELSLEIGEKLFAGQEEKREIQERFQEKLQKEKPGKVLLELAEELGLEQEKGIRKLLDMADFYKKTESFLLSLSFGVESDLRRQGQKKYTSDSVTLMTLHGSKGLEFSQVIFYGAGKGKIPLEGEDIEEERRLFYVGMTRAKDGLTITSSGEGSPFLEEIEEEVLEREETGGSVSKEEDRQMSLFDFSGIFG